VSKNLTVQLGEAVPDRELHTLWSQDVWWKLSYPRITMPGVAE
jgi:hypothetical protein